MELNRPTTALLACHWENDVGHRVVLVADVCEAATDQAHAATLASFALLGEVAAT